MYGNPYMFNPGFNQLNQQMQQLQQFQQPQPQPQPQTPAFSVGQVATVDQVEQIQLQPGERKIVLVQSQPVLAMRTADAMGLVNTRYFQLVDYNPHAQTSPMQGEYAPLSVVQDMQAQISELTQQIMDMKGAMSNAKSSVKRNADANA